MKSTSKNTAIVIPARNEEAVIGKMIRLLLAVYSDYICQIIIVDDGSSDKTPKIVSQLSKLDKRVQLVKRSSPHGVGLALRDGIRHVKETAQYIFTLDADFIRNIVDLDDFFHEIKNYDGLVGSRYLEQNSLIQYPWLKKICNRSFHMIIYFLLGIKQKDLTNNFKLYKKEIFDTIHLTSHDYAINAETGIYPILLGFKIKELPVTWYARGKNMGDSKFNLFPLLPSYIKVIQNSIHLRKSSAKKAR